jgi:Xaa-Pro dipeptidase
MGLIGKINRLTPIMKKNQMDLMVIGPSSDLEYLTGLSPHPDERFMGLFIFSDNRYFYISPEIYYEETRDYLGNEADIFIWNDNSGPIGVVEEALRKYGVNHLVIGINDGIKAVDLIDFWTLFNSRFVNGSSATEELRIIKTHEERDYLRQASLIADDVVGEVVKFIRPGITEKDILKKIDDLFEYKWKVPKAFAIVASGPNSSKPHYNDDKRVIEENDIIVLDLGCRVNGYHSDISRTVFVGEPNEEQRKIYEIIVHANTEAEKFARKGVKAEDVDNVARQIIIGAGYGEYFLNRTGHGIGMAVHESPYIKKGNRQILDNGMAFSVEPGIYIQGKFGMRVENIVLIHNDDGEVLNKFTKELITV